MKTILCTALTSVIALAGAAHAADVVHHKMTISGKIFGCTKPMTTERGLQVSSSGDQGAMSKFVDATLASGDCVGIPAGANVFTGRGYPGDGTPDTMLSSLACRAMRRRYGCRWDQSSMTWLAPSKGREMTDNIKARAPT